MDKQGALYFKLLTGVFLLVLAGYGLERLWPREPSYELYSTQICEVGDGLTVSGFAVRYESLLYSREKPVFLSPMGQWIGGGQALAATSGGKLVTSRGGYLSYEADGYETLLTPEFILECKEEELLNLTAEDLPSHTVGKLVHDHKWYFAVPGNFPEFSPGDRVRLSIEDGEWEAEVLRTQEVLVLQCMDSVHRILSLREATGELLLPSQEGISLPKEAIYYEDGETYVYVLQGAQARRKTVHILRLRDDILWIHPTDLPEGAQVILTEKEITDGTVLK